MSGLRAHGGQIRFVVGLWISAILLMWGCGVDSRSTSTQKPASLEEYLGQCEDWGRGWLAPERLGQRCDQVIVDGWDRSRKSGDPWAVFETLDLGVLQPPIMGAAKPSGMDGVEVHELIRGTATLRSQGDREAWSRSFKQAGWMCVQSEWRTIGYSWTGTHFSTEVSMNLHLLRTKDLVRAEARGRWLMDWGVETNLLTAKPLWLKATWKSGEWLEKSGTPRFVERWSASLNPSSRGGGEVDPLIIADWDGDGREDLVMAGANRWFRWDQSSGWSTNRIIPFDDISIQAAVVADFDKDGHLDLMAPGNNQLQLFRGNGSGGVELPPMLTPSSLLKTPSAMAVVDLDRDGDLDLWVSQYDYAYTGQSPAPFDGATNGPSGSFWRNSGSARFEESLGSIGLEPSRDSFTYSGVFLDTDGDNLPEFLQISDFRGVDFYRGSGASTFRWDTQKALGEARGFGMGHIVGDFDRDGRPDFMMIGMNSVPAIRMEAAGVFHPGFPKMREGRRELSHGNRVWLNRGSDGWKVPAWERQVAETGWSWGGAWLDSNNDGLGEFYIVNGFVSNESAFDFEQAERWSCEVYQGGLDRNPARSDYIDHRSRLIAQTGVSEGGHYRNQWLAPVGGDWQELGWIGGIALPEDCRNVVAWDYDGDGLQDLVVVTKEIYPTPQTVVRLFHNEQPGGHWLAVRVPPSAGVSPWGSEVTVTLSDGSIRREWLVDQQGFRTQPPPQAHFGLGSAKPRSVKVRWPDGVEREEAVSTSNRTVTISRL